MNILHHKSWHVRTKKNIERVRRDEEKAAEEEKEKQRRIALAEQEARTDLLRSRSKNKIKDRDQDEIKQGSCTDLIPTTSEVSLTTQKGNINFFKEIEDGLRKQGINEEHAKEKRAEKEKWEKSIGLLTYLGKSNIEEQNETPWYVSGKKRKREDSDEETNEKDFKYLKEKKKKAYLDPLVEMKEYVDKKKKKKKYKDHKEKKHKKQKHKEKEKSKTKLTSLPQPSTSKTIEQLRAERLKREQKEKVRSAELFSKIKGDNSKHSDSESEEEDRSRKYNSQYNPELSRKYKKPRYEDYS